MCKKIYKAEHPSKVLSEMNRAASILRDIFNDTFTGIHIDDETLYLQVKAITCMKLHLRKNLS